MVDPRVIVVAVGVAASFAAGWWVNGNRADATIAKLKTGYDASVAANASTTLAAQRRLDDQRTAEAGRVAGIDHAQTQLLKDARDETDRLRRCIADGTCGLRVRAICPKPAVDVPSAPANTSVDTPTSAGLDRDVGEDYFRFRDALTLVQRQLAGCQQILGAQK